MIEQSSDVMHEEGIQLFGDLFLVRELERSLEGDPEYC